MYCDERKKLILARLRLAQELLEESDKFEGYDLFSIKPEDYLFHQRYERESLVVYLLLTCFDMLGQQGGFTTFENWLNSKKASHEEQKSKVVGLLSAEDGVLMSSLKIYREYQEHYGVKNSFYSGVMNLKDCIRDRLLESISLSFNPEYGLHGPNVSTPSRPLDDKELELKLKLKYLYGKRNKFTHSLDQVFRASNPFMANRVFENGACWSAIVESGDLKYLISHSEVELLASGGAYVYSAMKWPFVLFESVYGALGMDFDVTSISIKFQVMVLDNKSGTATTYNNVEHKYLKSADHFFDAVALSNNNPP